MGIRDKPTAPASPWQNGFAERLIESIRRECLDHIIVLGEAHLRRILKSYADYYNGVRTHRSLDKDATVSRQIQRIGSIKSHAILGGLHPGLSFRYTHPSRNHRSRWFPLIDALSWTASERNSCRRFQSCRRKPWHPALTPARPERQRPAQQIKHVLSCARLVVGSPGVRIHIAKSSASAQLHLSGRPR
jgi:hypothetical protein